MYIHKSYSYSVCMSVFLYNHIHNCMFVHM